MSRGVDSYNRTWDAPAKGVMIGRGNYLYVVGCNVDLYLFRDDTTDLIGACTSTCVYNRETMDNSNAEGYCNGNNGCCSISVQRDIQSFWLKLVRHAGAVAEAVPSVKVIISEYYKFHTNDLYSAWVNSSNLQGLWLRTVITDQPTCESGQMNEDSYACYNGSNCEELAYGYNCFCPSYSRQGNTYVANGCIQAYNPMPKGTCTRSCGNITIPFPFGIEEGCFANANFRLNRTSSNAIVLDRRYAQYHVTNISIDDGFLSVSNMLNDTGSNNMERIVDTTNIEYLMDVTDGIFDFSQEDEIKIKWVVANLTCEQARLNNAAYACISDNSYCLNVTRGKIFDGYRCKCSDGFQGNPYLQNDCSDIDECSIPNKCNGICHNFDGGFNCTSCSHGKVYDPTKRKCTMSAKQHNLILEDEVPLLVYEFISNGTLYDLLHTDITTKCLLSWVNRIRIAMEAAGALAYLHSAAAIPIFHRDVKSSNILLDENFTAKVSDFGASRSLSLEETHVVTIMQGTFGYLDPEYYHTGELTEKSDVYSFGVILVELLTRKKPIFINNLGAKQSLSHYFVEGLREGALMEMIDSRVVEEADQEDINDIASLTEACLRDKGGQRPTMKEVEMRLQYLRTKVLREAQNLPKNDEEIEPLLLPNTRNLPTHINPFNAAHLTSQGVSGYSLEHEFASSIYLPR
ncbi:unnamed protein product [Urochloa decumbens]|uniref:Protein kinase domain-containing protein n=1 Tax=Urochloa decumbens TaxID=240449 RepID=A0ABC8V9R9_9POAL